MNSERYAQVRRLFLAACELPESEMGPFLDHSCAGDPALREELDSLLKQPRETTIIGTSDDDTADGKVLSPLAGLPQELVPADVPMEETRTAASNARSRPPRFAAGEIIAAGRYKILGPLGGGGEGEVYKAHDQVLDQDLALKFPAGQGPASRHPRAPAARAKQLRGQAGRAAGPIVMADSTRPPAPAQTGAATARSRILNEVAMAREVTHPNVVRVYDIGQLEDGEMFISMELIDGEDLASVLKRDGRLSRETTVQIARELCAGLGAAHDQGVLHRDLKPSNIVIDEEGHAHIADFGIAAFAPTDVDHEPASHHPTLPAARAKQLGGKTGRAAGPTEMADGTRRPAPEIPLAGTPAFMDPGLFHHQQPSKQSDLYALGVVLYQAATGRGPFEDVPADGLQAVGKPVPPSRRCPDIEPALERAILQCLAEDPARRPESAMAVAALLPDSY